MARRGSLAGATAGFLMALAPEAVLASADERSRGRRAWYVPDHAKVQLAGNIGFVSPGVGYAWLDRRLEADAFFGWVPRAIGGEDIFAVTGKVTWLPWRVRARSGVDLQPFTLSTQLTYTFGSEYWITEPDKYPPNYWPLPTALRAAIAVGGAVARPLWRFERVALYYELVALDVMLGFWIGNRDALGPLDVFSLALGTRLEF